MKIDPEQCLALISLFLEKRDSECRNWADDFSFNTDEVVPGKIPTKQKLIEILEEFKRPVMPFEEKDVAIIREYKKNNNGRSFTIKGCYTAQTEKFQKLLIGQINRGFKKIAVKIKEDKLKIDNTEITISPKQKQMLESLKDGAAKPAKQTITNNNPSTILQEASREKRLLNKKIKENFGLNEDLIIRENHEGYKINCEKFRTSYQ